MMMEVKERNQTYMFGSCINQVRKFDNAYKLLFGKIYTKDKVYEETDEVYIALINNECKIYSFKIDSLDLTDIIKKFIEALPKEVLNVFKSMAVNNNTSIDDEKMLHEFINYLIEHKISLMDILKNPDKWIGKELLLDDNTVASQEEVKEAQEDEESDEEADIIKDAEIISASEVTTENVSNIKMVSDDEILKEVGDKNFNKVKNIIDDIEKSKKTSKNKRKIIDKILKKYRLNHEDKMSKDEKTILNTVESVRPIYHRVKIGELSDTELTKNNLTLIAEMKLDAEIIEILQYAQSRMVINRLDKTLYEILIYNGATEEFYIDTTGNYSNMDNSKIMTGPVILIPTSVGGIDCIAASLTTEVLTDIISTTVKGIYRIPDTINTQLAKDYLKENREA